MSVEKHSIMKRKAVLDALSQIREKRFGIYEFNGESVETNTIKGLAEVSGVSRDAIYRWEKAENKRIEILEEAKAKKRAKKEVKDIILEEVIEEGKDKKTVLQEYIFGQRHMSSLAQALGLKGYGSMSRGELLLKVGLGFIQESGLIPMESENHV